MRAVAIKYLNFSHVQNAKKKKEKNNLKDIHQEFKII